MMKFIRTLVQIGILLSFSILGNVIVARLGWKIPGSIVGLILVFLLLQFKVLKVEWLTQGANWLIAEMLLFYVPSAVGIVQYRHLMQVDGIRVLTVIAVSTALVMVSTGFLADKLATQRTYTQKG